MKKKSKNRSHMRGVSLLELLIAMAILGIIVTIAMPSMAGFGANQRLLGAAEQIHGHLQQARSEAVARSIPVFVNFSATGTTTWVYGVSTMDSCTVTITDPATANACTIVVDDGDGDTTETADLVLMRFPSSDFADVEMLIAGFSSGTQVAFDPIRGTSTTGQINLEGSNGNQLRVAVSMLGRVAICSPDGSVRNYESC